MDVLWGNKPHSKTILYPKKSKAFKTVTHIHSTAQWNIQEGKSKSKQNSGSRISAHAFKYKINPCSRPTDYWENSESGFHFVYYNVTRTRQRQAQCPLTSARDQVKRQNCPDPSTWGRSGQGMMFRSQVVLSIIYILVLTRWVPMTTAEMTNYVQHGQMKADEGPTVPYKRTKTNSGTFYEQSGQTGPT